MKYIYKKKRYIYIYKAEKRNDNGKPCTNRTENIY